VAKAAGASHDSTLSSLAELFTYIETFLRRLETYTKVPSTPDIQEVVVNVMVEVLSVLAVTTKEIGQGKTSEFFNNDEFC
jgi:hypothetical protein